MYHFSLKSPIMQICSHLWPSSTLLSTYHKMLLSLALKYLWNLLFTLSICLLYAIQWPLFRFRFNVWPPTVTPWLSPLSLALLASLCNPLSNDPWRCKKDYVILLPDLFLTTAWCALYVDPPAASTLYFIMMHLWFYNVLLHLKCSSIPTFNQLIFICTLKLSPVIISPRKPSYPPQSE